MENCVKGFSLVLLFVFVCGFNAYTQESIKGTVVERNSKLPISFATVVYQKNSLQKGVITDVHGKFEIVENGISSITVSCMGYKPKQVAVASTSNKLNLVIELEEAAYEIKGVVITPKDNPALRIIRNALEKKDENNYQKYDKYSYNCYFKTIIDLKFPSDSAALDSLTKKQKERIAQRAGFISESVVKTTSVDGRVDNRIVAQRTSGFESPILVQSFFSLFHSSISFYNNNIPLFLLPFSNDRSVSEYVSPLADGCLNIYSYQLEDKYTDAADTIFIVSFHPKKGTTFNGLVGTLFISSNNFAIKSIVVEPYEKGLIGFRFRQDYDFINGKWFPTVLDEEIGWVQQKVSAKVNAYPAYVIKSIIDSVNYNPIVNKGDVRLETVYVDEESLKSSDLIIGKARKDSLSPREINTYQFMDSIGQKKNFDYWINLAPKLTEGKIPLYFLDIEIDKLYLYNKYEGSRVGLGLSINNKLSKYFSVGGFFAYGFGDEESKYGGNLEINLDRYNEVKLKFFYQNDLREAGANLFSRLAVINTNDYLRRYLGYRFDNCIEQRAEFSFRAFRYLKISSSLSLRDFKVLYPYTYKGAAFTGYRADEIQIAARYSYNEKMSTLGSVRYVSDIGNPTVSFNYHRGINFINKESLEYNRYEASISLVAYNGRIGQSNIRVDAGLIDRSLPYGLLFTGEGSWDKNFSTVINGSFQTMLPYEFLSDRYVNLFYSHNFGTLLFKTKKFKPQFIVVQNSGIGMLSNASYHGIDFDQKDKIFNESGLIINNIIRLKYFNMFYIGFGVGGFYRWGAYAYDTAEDNIALKFSLSITLK